MFPKFFPYARETLEMLRVHGQIPLLLGCSSQGFVANAMEVEEDAGLVVALNHLLGADLRAVRFTQQQVAECTNPAYWHAKTGVGAESGNGWLVFGDPISLDAELWLKQWNEACAPPNSHNT